MIADLSNGAFEFIAALMILNNCRVLRKDKCRRGISKFSCVFFLLWGFWNTFYYPHLGQMWSFAGGLCVVLSNLIWIGMMIHYDRRSKTLNVNTPIIRA